jgi:hypothetical protein
MWEARSAAANPLRNVGGALRRGESPPECGRRAPSRRISGPWPEAAGHRGTECPSHVSGASEAPTLTLACPALISEAMSGPDGEMKGPQRGVL